MKIKSCPTSSHLPYKPISKQSSKCSQLMTRHYFLLFPHSDLSEEEKTDSKDSGIASDWPVTSRPHKQQILRTAPNNFRFGSPYSRNALLQLSCSHLGFLARLSNNLTWFVGRLVKSLVYRNDLLWLTKNMTCSFFTKIYKIHSYQNTYKFKVSILIKCFKLYWKLCIVISLGFFFYDVYNYIFSFGGRIMSIT